MQSAPSDSGAGNEVAPESPVTPEQQ
jgi:hypothetical protein